MLIKKIVSSLLTLGCLAAAGCTNTVRGAGEDISAAGDAVQRSTK